MKRVIFAASMLAISFTLMSCGGEKKPQGDPDLIKVAIDETLLLQRIGGFADAS